jgi:DNA polymerase-1
VYSKVAKQILRSSHVALDTETYGETPDIAKNPMRCGLKGVSLAWYHKGRRWSHYWSFNPQEMPLEQATAKWKAFKKAVLIPLFKRRVLVLIMHNASFDLRVLRRRGLWPKTKRIADTMIESYLLDENSPHDLKWLSKTHLGADEALSFKATEKLLKDIVKEGDKAAKAFGQKVWEGYRDFHKGVRKLSKLRGDVRSIVMELQTKVLKKKVLSRANKRVGRHLRKKARERSIRMFHEYARKDALWTLMLHEKFLPQLQAEGFGALYWNLYQEVLRESIEMEWAGIKVDVGKLKEIQALLDKKIRAIRKKIDRRFGKDFNPGSSNQVRHLLWVEMKLSPPPWLKEKDYKKDGLPGSGEDILEWLVANKGIKKLEDVLTYRKLTKLKKTYVDSLIEEAEADPEGRIHTNFSLIKVTSRWGSSKPNLQNIPRWDTLQKYIPDIPSLRACFIVPKGNTMLVADYSQIDLRVMTHCSQDPSFLKSYRTWKCGKCKKTGETNKPYHACPLCGEPEKDAGGRFELGEDLHRRTGEATGLIKKYGPKVGRSHSKPVNFGAVYLMGYHTLSQQTGMSNEEAKQTLEQYHQNHPGVRAMADRLWAQIFAHGFFRLINGQKRRFDREIALIKALNKKGDEASRKEAYRRQYGVMREGMNNSGQGGAAVIINTAIYLMRKDRKWLEKRGVRLLLQVHDELVFECPDEYVAEVKPWIKAMMEKAGRLRVPVLADISHGANWETAK